MFAVGSMDWPGLAKLNEEMGECIQVVGKLMQTGGDVQHWEGDPLNERLCDELADVQAAIDFLLEHNSYEIDRERWRIRRSEKLKLFKKWRREQRFL